jgi:molybdate transport system regulatory protein
MVGNRGKRRTEQTEPELFIRVMFPKGTYLGPGKVQLLEGIAEHGSIAAAGKAMGMSYKRAWYLADAINEMFEEPLVLKQHGGRSGGGAALTKQGHAVINHYRSVQKLAAEAAKAHIRELELATRKPRRSRAT